MDKHHINKAVYVYTNSALTNRTDHKGISFFVKATSLKI